MGVFRHTQSYSKQQVSYISKTNLAIKLSFCMWVAIHGYIYLIQSIYMVLDRHNWACQKQFPWSKPQYVKSNVSYDTDFLHVGRHL